MGRIVLAARLAARDLRRRPVEAALLLLAITAATSTLTLGLVLRGVISKPYQSTREATAGPDVVAGVLPPMVGGRPGEPPVFGDRPADRAGLEALAEAPGVVGHSGPYPVVWTTLRAHGRTVAVQAEGRDTARAAVDQPKLTQGGWVGDGGVVVEAAFADALGVRAGDPITLKGRRFKVAGVAVTAAAPPYPEVSCLGGLCQPAGLVWLTQADARSLAPRAQALSYVLNLKLADPAAAPAFVDEHAPPTPASGPDRPVLQTWQGIRDTSASVVRNQRRALLTGGWLLGLLAVASVAVLVGGRMADQIRRVGLLKAVGGTPGLVAAVLLAEYLVVALLAAAAGLAIGWLAAPLLTDPGAGLLGARGCAVAHPLHGRAGHRRRARRGRRRELRPGRPRRPHQHRPRARRLGPPAPAHRVADRALGAPARPAAARVAGGRPAAAPRRPRDRQHRDHGQRDRRRAGSARRPAASGPPRSTLPGPTG